VAEESEKIDTSDINYQDKTSTASFTLSPEEAKQYRGSIYFKAIDHAGRISEKYDDKAIVIDTIAPSVNITYKGELVQKVNASDQTVSETDAATRFIYRSAVTATIEVNEANFFEGKKSEGVDTTDFKVVVKRDGSEVTDYSMTDWEQVEGTDQYIRKITLETDGDYIINVVYRDKSANDMQFHSSGENKNGILEYNSNVMTIDTVAPLIHVTYDNNNSKSNYFNAGRRATIQITERNFRAAEVHTVITAKDIQGNILSGCGISSMGGISAWTKISEDTWQATVTYESDAAYTFDIDYKDMANNSAMDYAGDSFVIDKTSPDMDSLGISYSTPQIEKVIQTITFGYYKPAVTVTLRAEDRTSGVYYFSWSYKQEAGNGLYRNGYEDAKALLDKIIVLGAIKDKKANVR
jgi:hypothetical protein